MRSAADRDAGDGPRWEVFKQDAEGRPHQAVGSVHAADAEHALLMARSVHARRPAAISLWVVPAEAVLSVTAEQLEPGGASGEADAPGMAGGAADGPSERYLVFRKTSHRRTMTFVDHVGEVTAAGPWAALAAARATFNEPPALTWCIVPAQRVSASPEAEAAAWFEPARAKTYKQQAAYGTTAPARRRRER